MAIDLKRTAERVLYYAKGAARDLTPPVVYAARLAAFRKWIAAQPIDENVVDLDRFRPTDSEKQAAARRALGLPGSRPPIAERWRTL